MSSSDERYARRNERSQHPRHALEEVGGLAVLLDPSPPAGVDGDVLFTINFVSHGGGDNTGLCREAPALLAVISGERHELAVRRTLEHEIARGTEGAAIPGASVFDTPGFLLLYRVPGQQSSFH